MYYHIFTERDSTIYEKYPNKNTGIDEILELVKIASGSLSEGFYQSNTFNSRILLDFATQLTEISNSIVSGEIPTASIANGSQFFLSLKAMNAESLPISYSLVAYPISESWVNGTGYYNDRPETRNGVSWYYRDSYDQATSWNTSSTSGNSGFSNGTTFNGGGNWYTGSLYEATQSFNYSSPDVRLNITNMVDFWLKSGSSYNNGMIIKRPEIDEKSGDEFGTLQFFGKDTHTIYVPKIEVAWDDSSIDTTGLDELSDDNITLYFKNLKSEYLENTKTKLRIVGRKTYPTKTYSTASFYSRVEHLPTSSYYAVKDAVTDETIIPFDHTFTKISCDSTGNYFNIRLNSFLPERTYKFVIKTVNDGGDNTRYHDNGYFFKVVR